jgi:hypothetical protein
MSGQCRVNIKPTVSVGRVPTIAEHILPKLFDNDVVIDTDSILKDKKKFFHMRLELTKVLTPIVERIAKSGKETTIGLSLDEEGKLSVYQMKTGAGNDVPNEDI